MITYVHYVLHVQFPVLRSGDCALCIAMTSSSASTPALDGTLESGLDVLLHFCFVLLHEACYDSLLTNRK